MIAWWEVIGLAMFAGIVVGGVVYILWGVVGRD
jgi:hypothetical protein